MTLSLGVELSASTNTAGVPERRGVAIPEFEGKVIKILFLVVDVSWSLARRPLTGRLGTCGTLRGAFPRAGGSLR